MSRLHPHLVQPNLGIEIVSKVCNFNWFELSSAAPGRQEVAGDQQEHDQLQAESPAPPPEQHNHKSTRADSCLMHYRKPEKTAVIPTEKSVASHPVADRGISLG